VTTPAPTQAPTTSLNIDDNDYNGNNTDDDNNTDDNDDRTSPTTTTAMVVTSTSAMANTTTTSHMDVLVSGAMPIRRTCFALMSMMLGVMASV